VVAVVDTNCDPDDIDYPIPGNDDAIRAIKLFASRVADAIMEGRSLYEKRGDSQQEEADESVLAPTDGGEEPVGGIPPIEGDGPGSPSVASGKVGKEGHRDSSFGPAPSPREEKPQEMSAAAGTEAGPAVEAEGGTKRQAIAPGGPGTE